MFHIHVKQGKNYSAIAFSFLMVGMNTKGSEQLYFGRVFTLIYF
jgi:hypothetical protein